MSEFKSLFLKSVEESLVGKLSQSQLEMVIDEVTKALKDYDIDKSKNELITYEAINEGILKRFCASLYIEGKSEKTIQQYKRTADKLFEATQKHFPNIEVYDIRLFLACEKQRGLANTSLENTRANLSAFFQWMTNEEIIPKNPCAKIAPIKCPEKVRIPFSSVDIDRLRLACKTKKERAIIEFLLASGVRVSELSEMKVQDIDFFALSVHVVHGKGDKERTTYITDLARTHLGTYLEGRKEKGDALFYGNKGRPITASGIRTLLIRIAARVDVANVHPHRFRRTFASGLAARGMDVQEIQKLMGHSDINTTMKYIHLCDESTKNAYRRYIA